jgi:outer membrane protein
MKNFKHLFLGLGLVACLLSQPVSAQNPTMGSNNLTQLAVAQPFKIGVVNTKRCLEESKLGKQEQVNFEKMKAQMEAILQEKEKGLEEIESKLNDDDYMDSISEDAANELKRQRRTIRSEGMQLQNQYMQTLQQANTKVVQKLTDFISKASTQVAKENNFDIILTDEACTFFNEKFDVSKRIVEKMDAMFDAEQKDNATKTH